LWHNLATDRFYIRVFLLLGYLPDTPNEHYQSGFKVFNLVGVELHFVWPLAADFPGIGIPNRRILFPASTALQVMEVHKRFHLDKVVVRGNENLKNVSAKLYVLQKG